MLASSKSTSQPRGTAAVEFGTDAHSTLRGTGMPLFLAAELRLKVVLNVMSRDRLQMIGRQLVSPARPIHERTCVVGVLPRNGVVYAVFFLFFLSIYPFPSSLFQNRHAMSWLVKRLDMSSCQVSDRQLSPCVSILYVSLSSHLSHLSCFSQPSQVNWHLLIPSHRKWTRMAASKRQRSPLTATNCASR